MDLKTAIGQMIVMGFWGTELDDETKRVMESCRIGNVILFARNLENIEQIAKLTKDIRDTVARNTGHPAFICIDQEGGVVTRLPAEIPQAPGAMAVASVGDCDLARDVGRMTGEQLKLLGINLNFAPDVDVNSNPANPVIGVRSFGEDADTVIKYSIPELEGMTEAGVAPCVKHFPGHGDTDVDSHLGLPTVDKTRSELDMLELKPFMAAADAGVPFIMTSHSMFPKIDEERPATLSHELLTELLRKDLGFDGVIVTDCLEMGAIKNTFGTAKGAVMAAEAGADMLCISQTKEEVEKAAALLLERAEADKDFAARIEEAACRVLAAKADFPGCDPDPEALRRKCPDYLEFTGDLRARSIKVTGGPKVRGEKSLEKTLILGCLAFRSTLVSSEPLPYSFAKYLGEKLGADYEETPVRPTDEEADRIIGKAKDYDRVILGTYNAHIIPEQRKFLERMSREIRNLTVVALRNPYDLNYAGSAVKIAAYEYSPAIFEKLLGVL